MGSIVAELAEKLASTAGKLAIDGTLSLKEQADAESDTAGEGQIWINTATPNELYFTTDAGDDIALTTGINAAGSAGPFVKAFHASWIMGG